MHAFFFFSSRRRHTRLVSDWSSDVCSSDLSSAMKNEITFKDGRAEQSNFDNYPLLRMSETPTVEIHMIASGEKPGGMGEVGVPLAAPAIANAIAAATGKRIRKMPLLSA